MSSHHSFVSADMLRFLAIGSVLVFTPLIWNSGLWLTDRFWVDTMIFISAALFLGAPLRARLGLRLFAAIILLVGAYWITSIFSMSHSLSQLMTRIVLLGSVWGLTVAFCGSSWGFRLALLVLSSLGLVVFGQLIEFVQGYSILGSSVWGLQAAGPVHNPNLLCALLLSGLPWTLVLWEKGRWGRNVSMVIGVLGVLSFMIAGSRTGMIAVILTGLFVALRFSGKARRYVLFGSAACVLLASIAYLPHLLSLFNPNHITNIQRFHMIRSGLAMGACHPFLGWGPGTMGEVYPLFQGFPKWELHLHSLPLQVWAGMGFTGLAAWGMILYAIGREIIMGSNSTPRVAASIGIVGMLSCQLTDYFFWIPVATIFFWMNVGVLLGWREGAAVQIPSWIRRMAPALFIPIWIPLVLFPDFGVRLLMRGDQALADGRFDDAVEIFDESDRYLGNHPLPALLKSTALLEQRQVGEARRILRAIEDRDPLLTGSLNFMGWSSALAGDWKGAEEAFSKAQGRDAMNDWAPHLLDKAYAQSRLGETETVRVTMKEAGRLYPNLARYFAEEVLKDDSTVLLLKESSKDVDPFYTQDLLYGTQFRYPKGSSYSMMSEETLRGMIKANPLHYPIRTALAARLIESGRDSEALVETTKAVFLCGRQYAPDPRLLYLHGMALAATGKAEESSRFMNAALAAGQTTAQPMRNILSVNYRIQLKAPLTVSMWSHPTRW